MKTLSATKYTVGVAATIATLCACSRGSETALGPSAAGMPNPEHVSIVGALGRWSPATFTGTILTMRPIHGKSWMSPQLHATITGFVEPFGAVVSQRPGTR